MWFPRWALRLYADLYAGYRGEVFTFSDALSLSKSAPMAKVGVSLLRRGGALYVHRREGYKRLYRLCDPETLTLLIGGRLASLGRFKQGRYTRLIGLLASELSFEVEGLRSLVVYGSVARGNARLNSDLDLLVVAAFKESFGKRLEHLVKVEWSWKVSTELNWLNSHDVETHVSFLPLTPEEFERHPPILLDVVDEGVTIYDDGFFQWRGEELRSHLRVIGARRVFLTPEEWYWDLKPGLIFSEVLEL